MMKGRLITALDFSKKKGTPFECYSMFVRGKWFVVKAGNGYSNHYLVTEYDADGEKWLKSHQIESGIEDS